MRLIIGAVILVIFVILFFAGGETGKKLQKQVGLKIQKRLVALVVLGCCY